MSLDNLAKPIAVIDMANMRDDSNSRSLLNWRKKNYSSWGYIDSVITSLKNCIENLTIIPIFDAGLANNFAGNDIAITDFRSGLDYRDEQYVYFMREHYLEADPLILQVAREVGGFVISGDKYEKYTNETAKINELVFVPVKKSTPGEFEFFKSSEFYGIRGKNRNFEGLTNIHKLRTIKNFIDANSDFVANDTFVRDQVFGPEGIEFRFWEDHFRITRQGEKEILRDKPFANLNLSIPKLFGEKQATKVLVKAKRKIGKQRKEQVVVFCDSLNQINLEAEAEVQLVGKLGRSGEQIFLEWFRGDKAVRITGFHTTKDLDRNFIKIPGVLSRGSDGFELETAEDAQFEQLSFTDAVIHRLSRIVVRGEDEALRRWSLPSLNWGRKANISVPKRPKTIPPPPGYRYRTSEERLLDLTSESIRAARWNHEAVKDSDSPLPQSKPLVTASLESRATSGNVLSQPNPEMGEESQSGALSTGQQKFELSKQPIFRTAFRKRRTQTAQSRPKKRGLKWILVFLLAIAAAITFLVVNFRSETTSKEVPIVSLKCWGEIEKICIET